MRLLPPTANDMLKYLAAQLGLKESPLYPLIQQSHAIRHTTLNMGRTAMPWVDRGVYQPSGANFLGHGGGTFGFSTFVGFDTQHRRGVVVLSNQRIVVDDERPWIPACLGWTILQSLPLTSESGRRPVYETVGVGVGLELDEAAQTLRITKVFPQSPAGKAKLSNDLVPKGIDVDPIWTTLELPLEQFTNSRGQISAVFVTGVDIFGVDDVDRIPSGVDDF